MGTWTHRSQGAWLEGRTRSLAGAQRKVQDQARGKHALDPCPLPPHRDQPHSPQERATPTAAGQDPRFAHGPGQWVGQLLLVHPDSGKTVPKSGYAQMGHWKARSGIFTGPRVPPDGLQSQM